ncbi:MAG: macB 4 [Acidobacteriaceae bacterium]|nr:macB 4 [Acidobacteriaceae bacterium]
MSLQVSWGIAVKALRRNKLQTALTMMGMTIGVATVLTMIALGSGAQNAIQDQVRSAGMNLIVVEGGNWSRGNATSGSNMSRYEAIKPTFTPATWNPSRTAHFLRVQGDSEGASGGPMVHDTGRPGDALDGHGAATTLIDDDVAAIRKVKGVQYASGGIHDTLTIVHGDARLLTSIHGDDTALPRIRRGWTFPFGRFYNSKEEKKAENVVVLGQFVSEKLFGKTNPVGQTLNLKGEDFKVVGVIGSGSWMVTPASGDDQFDAVYVPVATMHRIMKQSNLSMVAVTTESTGDVLRVEDAIKALLRQRHNISNAEPDDFTVKGEGHKTMAHGMRPDVASAVMGNAAGLDKLTLNQLSKTLDQASSTMAALLTSIAAVSLIVGGIGVMNIMLLSVSQRTREIGIRRAIGARSQDVLTQFLLEATTLSLVGGLLGILIGCIASVSIARMAQWSTSISTPAIVISFTVSAAIGIFFGYYPARQASQILPIKALRHE